MSILVKLFLACLIIIISFTSHADEVLRTSLLQEVAKVNVLKDTGRVVYDHSKSRTQFSQVAGEQLSKYTMGVTITELEMTGTVNTDTSKVPGGYLVYITSVDVKMSYGDIVVLIDKKYPVGSCEYNAIISHENKHIGVARMVMDFYAPYVKQEIEKTVREIKPVKVNSEVNAGSIARRYGREVDRKLEPLLALIHEQLEKGNAQFDTPEVYKQDTARCSNW